MAEMIRMLEIILEMILEMMLGNTSSDYLRGKRLNRFKIEGQEDE
jgi:hypothetical protein